MGLCSASGFLCFGPSFFASAALILSIFANSRCYLMSLDEGNTVAQGIWDQGVPVQSIGLWCWRDFNNNDWNASNANVDSKYDSARALGTTTMVLGWIIWIFYLFAGCKRFPPKAFMFIGFLGICTCIFQSCVFLVNKSVICKEGCSLDTGGKCGIAAAVCWFVAGVFSCGVGRDVGGDEGEAPGGGDEKPDEEPEA